MARWSAFSHPFSVGGHGAYAAFILDELEQRYCGGWRVAEYFDLITGTSTGGILALGLGAGLSASELKELHLDRGLEIFLARRDSLAGRLKSFSGKPYSICFTATIEMPSPLFWRRSRMASYSASPSIGLSSHPSTATTAKF